MTLDQIFRYGRVITVKPADPAPGDDFLYDFGGATGLLLMAVSGRLTPAAAAAWSPRLSVDDGAAEFFQLTIPNTFAVGAVGTFDYALGLVATAQTSQAMATQALPFMVITNAQMLTLTCQSGGAFQFTDMNVTYINVPPL